MEENKKTVEKVEDIPLSQILQEVCDTLPEIPEDIKDRCRAIGRFINNNPSQLLMHSIVYILATTNDEKIRLEALRLLRDRLLDMSELW